MAAGNSFQFGVEIELLLGTSKRGYQSWQALAKDLSKRLTKAGVSTHVNSGNEKTLENYQEWSIVQEITIPHEPSKGLWGLELVSPVYSIYSYWAADLEVIFATLHASFTIHVSPHCSTHIHISGTPQPLCPGELAALAKAALYYEPALDLLVPMSRRGSTAYWCQSNRANPTLAAYASIHDSLAVLDDAASANTACAVVEAMNLFPAASAYGRAHGKKSDFVRGKVYKWNFTGMLQGSPHGTVEFRQPSGSTEAIEAQAWVTLAVAFVAGATMGGGYVGMAGDGASAEELWGLLTTGGQILGWDGLGAVEGLFERRTEE